MRWEHIGGREHALRHQEVKFTKIVRISKILKFVIKQIYILISRVTANIKYFKVFTEFAVGLIENFAVKLRSIMPLNFYHK